MGVKYTDSQRSEAALKDQMALLAGSSSMVRTQIYLSREEHEFVQAEAARLGEPMAAVIRSFIDEKMQLPEDAWSDNPMLRPTPVDPGFETPPDAAINHDHYLSGTPKKWIKVRGSWVEAPPLPADYYENETSYAAYHERVRQLEAAG